MFLAEETRSSDFLQCCYETTILRNYYSTWLLFCVTRESRKTFLRQLIINKEEDGSVEILLLLRETVQLLDIILRIYFSEIENHFPLDRSLDAEISALFEEILARSLFSGANHIIQDSILVLFIIYTRMQIRVRSRSSLRMTRAYTCYVLSTVERGK